jgi:hypothetical protein
VVLDDRNPLHRARLRLVNGRDRLVCLAVAGAIDGGMRSKEIERFARTMREREENEACVHLRPEEDGGRVWLPGEYAR